MKIRLLKFAALGMLVPAMLLAEPVQKKTIVGVWEVKTVMAGQSQAPLLSLAMYGSDGSFNTAGGYQALPTVAAVQELGLSSAQGTADGPLRATGASNSRSTPRCGRQV